jgi:hypothetical protein
MNVMGLSLGKSSTSSRSKTNRRLYIEDSKYRNSKDVSNNSRITGVTVLGHKVATSKRTGRNGR